MRAHAEAHKHACAWHARQAFVGTQARTRACARAGFSNFQRSCKTCAHARACLMDVCSNDTAGNFLPTYSGCSLGEQAFAACALCFDSSCAKMRARPEQAQAQAQACFLHPPGISPRSWSKQMLATGAAGGPIPCSSSNLGPTTVQNHYLLKAFFFQCSCPICQ